MVIPRNSQCVACDSTTPPGCFAFKNNLLAQNQLNTVSSDLFALLNSRIGSERNPREILWYHQRMIRYLQLYHGKCHLCIREKEGGQGWIPEELRI